MSGLPVICRDFASPEAPSRFELLRDAGRNGSNTVRTPFQQRCDQAWRDNRAAHLEFSTAVHHHADALFRSASTRLYAITDEASDAVKIGIARNPALRVAALQVGNPRPLALVVNVPAPTALENFIHRWLRQERITGEWFRCMSVRTLVVCEALMAADDLRQDDPTADAGMTVAVLADAAERVLEAA